MAYLYLYEGEYRTYAYLHDNFGYCVNPTSYMTYKSVDTWGQTGDDGYFDGNVELIPLEGEFYKNGRIGWMNANDLALYGRVYPSFARDDIKCIYLETQLVSNSARITCGPYNYYLIQEALNYGWVREDHLDDIGWMVESMFDYFILDKETSLPLHRGFFKIEYIEPPLNVIPANGITHVTAQINTVGGGIEHWIKLWIFVEVYQPQQLSFNPQYTFSQIPQPNLQHFKEEYTFSGIQQQILGYMDIEE